MSAYSPWADEIVVERGQGSKTAREDRHLYVAREGRDGDWVGMVGSEAPGGADAWAALFKSAPKMARALRDVLEHGGNARWIDERGVSRDLKREILAILSEAGVPCP